MALSKSSRSHKRRRNSSNDFDSDYSDSDTIEWSRKRVTEEEISEYLAKNAQKKAMKVAKKLNSHTVNGYSNDCNPFGDFNLNEKFVWRKKIERDVYQGLALDDLSVKAEKRRQRERMAEIEKVKKRREERALEKALHEEEMAFLEREHSRSEFQDLEKKEKEFDFNQSKIRSGIRLREGRAKPIDVLIKHLHPSHEFDIEVNGPYIVFKGLNLNEIEDLHEYIKLNLDLDIENVQYWEALLVICDWELGEARKRDALVRGEELITGERGVHASVEADVKKLLHGKTYEELRALQSQIESKMRSGAAKVVEYWEAILKRLHIYKARACLKEIHAKMLQKHLEILQQSSEEGKDTKTEENPRLNEEDSYSEPILGEAEAGSYSPQPLHREGDEDTIDPEEDRLILERKRKAVMEQCRVLEPTPEEKNFEKMAMKAMGTMEEGDAVFGSNDEINLDSQIYWLHDKYRPRKPKYFNRVHTGYEWNKYNRTHYDHDNPPPKTVQGYKFNIFYPDLVDKSKAPNYTIEKDGDSTETCIIRFHAGPPYEDIAFRIVNKEWDYSHKKGFKSTFERGILHLYFNIKRYRYRR